MSGGRVLLGALVLGACGGTRLPEERPDDAVFVFTRNQGMFPAFETIRIEGTRGTFEEGYDGARRTLTFTVADGALDELYRVFRDQRFDRIRTYEEDDVYDRGGTSVALHVGGRSWSARNGGRTYVMSGWRDAYVATRVALYRVAMDALDGLRVPVTVWVDETLVGHPVRVAFNDHTVFESKAPLTAPVAETVRELPGEVRVRATLGTDPPAHASRSWTVAAGDTIAVRYAGGHLEIAPGGEGSHGVRP